MSARTGPCGGYRVTGIPTAIRYCNTEPSALRSGMSFDGSGLTPSLGGVDSPLQRQIDPLPLVRDFRCSRAYVGRHMLKWHFVGSDPVASQCDIREGPAGDHGQHVYGLATIYCQVTPAVVQLPTREGKIRARGRAKRKLCPLPGPGFPSSLPVPRRHHQGWGRERQASCERGDNHKDLRRFAMVDQYPFLTYS